VQEEFARRSLPFLPGPKPRSLAPILIKSLVVGLRRALLHLPHLRHQVAAQFVPDTAALATFGLVPRHLGGA